MSVEAFGNARRIHSLRQGRRPDDPGARYDLGFIEAIKRCERRDGRLEGALGMLGVASLIAGLVLILAGWP